MSNQDKLIAIIRDVKRSISKNTEISERTQLAEDLGFDSIEMVTMMVAIEEAFGFSFDDEELSFETINSFGTLFDIITTKMRN